jgi:type I restriction enzyme S subunit
MQLSEVARTYNGNSISEDEKRKFYSGIAQGLPYIGTKDVGFDYSIEYESGVKIPADRLDGFKRASANTVLVCAEGGSAGRKIGHTDREVCFGNKLFAVSPSSVLDSRYLFYFFLTEDFMGQFRGAMAGLIGGVSLNKFKALRLPVPPRTEQRRIVAILDEAFEAIATAKANAELSLQNVREFFDCTLNRAIQGQLFSCETGEFSVSDLLQQVETARRLAISRGRYKAPKLDPIQSDARVQPPLPQDWRWAQLDSLTVGISDGVHKTPRYVAEGVPFVTVKNLTASRGISFKDLNYITREDHEEYIKRTNPERGDILITKDGTIGVVRLIDTDVEFSIFVSVALIKPALRELGPYLAYALRATSVQRQIVPQGAALKHLYLVDLRMLQVPLPPPHIQSQIVDRLDELDAETQRLASLYERSITALGELRSSLLRHAFSGELTTNNAKEQVKALA